jgi:hypothetical protein
VRTDKAASTGNKDTATQKSNSGWAASYDSARAIDIVRRLIPEIGRVRCAALRFPYFHAAESVVDGLGGGGAKRIGRNRFPALQNQIAGCTFASFRSRL